MLLFGWVGYVDGNMITKLRKEGECDWGKRKNDPGERGRTQLGEEDER
jgi:hypothetical protein